LRGAVKIARGVPNQNRARVFSVRSAGEAAKDRLLAGM
jgi:hypothetical protein